MGEISKSELEKLGKNVKRLRKARGMNQTSLAQAARTRPTTISAIENGINPNPGWDLLGRIAIVLNSCIHDLTQPEVSQDQYSESDPIPGGLRQLMQKQKELLALSEPRISLKELDWLAKTPQPEGREVTAEEYLTILRHFRLLLK